MARDIGVKRPAALHFIAGQVADLEERRTALYAQMEQDLAELEGIHQLLDELEQLRLQC